MSEYVRIEDYNEVVEYAPDWAVSRWDLGNPTIYRTGLWCFGHNRPDDVCERMAPDRGCIPGEVINMIGLHEHNWLDMKNEVISSGEYCPICGKVKEGST